MAGQTLAGMAPALKDKYLGGQVRSRRKKKGFLNQIAQERQGRTGMVNS